MARYSIQKLQRMHLRMNSLIMGKALGGKRGIMDIMHGQFMIIVGSETTYGQLNSIKSLIKTVN